MASTKEGASRPPRSKRNHGAPSRQRPDVDPGVLDRHLGNAIRTQRHRQKLTIADVAERAQLSPGMLSKIETGQASMSLESLQRLGAALGLSLISLFRNFDVPGGGAQLIKNGMGMEVVRRGTKKGHTYHLLAYDQGPRKLFEPFLITMDNKSEVFPTFEHPGVEFIYMLQGRIEYRHGKQTYVLEPGDAFTFRGDVPHGPERLYKIPIRFLSIIYYGGAENSED